VQADITSLTGYDGRFNTVIDSTLFHSLAVKVEWSPRGHASVDRGEQ
jgi:hypothetical protein